MIQIDDLVRQRLGGGQEPDRPGAWLNMRDLLDKEMPVVAAPRSNRRMIIGYFTGLLLLATATVGGYKLYTDRVADGGASVGGRIAGPSELAATGTKAQIDGNALSPVNQNRNTDPTSAAEVSNIASTTGTGSSGNNTIQSSGNTGNQSRSNNRGTGNRQIALANTDRMADGGIARSDKSTLPSVTPTERKTGNTTTAFSSAGADNNTSQKSNPKTDKSFTSSANGNVRGRRMNGEASPIQPADNKVFSSANTAPGVKNGAQKMAPALRLVFDTVETIELVYRRVYDARIQRTVYRLDTFPKGSIVIPRYVGAEEEKVARNDGDKKGRNKSGKPGNRKSKTSKESSASDKFYASSDDKQTAPGTQHTGSSASDKESGEEQAADPAGNLKLKSEHKGFSLWNAAKFEEAVNRFKFNLAKIQMYPGVMGGINASLFTPNSLGGFQVGLTSLFALNDWWSLVAEFKYIYRFNTGSTIRDDYKSIIPGTATINTVHVNGKDYNEYKWTDQNVNHYFNYETVRTFEVPLALRYNTGRFYFMSGINLVYGMKIDASEVTRPRGDMVSHRELRPNVHTIEPYISNDKPLVKISDFGSRFGTGYLLGAGYMFTPSLYLDLRLAQTFWDNSKTNGAKQVSNDLLRTPSFQLSVGYRFGQK